MLADGAVRTLSQVASRPVAELPENLQHLADLYRKNADAIEILTVDGVEATEQSVEDGEYPLARPLFIYSDAGIMTEKPQVADFVNFYLTYVNEEVERVGYFPASAESLEQAKGAWLAATGME